VTQSFSVLLSPAKFSSVHSSSKIVKVSNLEWPRVLVWAKAFANESNPKLNQHQTIKLAKQMKEDGQLFVLKNIHGQTQAMGGFGRFTPNASVINMVYVNPEKRKRGVATDLTLKLLEYSKASGYEKSILFSDYLMDGNLYKNIGFLEKGLIQEIAFEAMT
jgi:predicted GNAT family acetyltransferase